MTNYAKDALPGWRGTDPDGGTWVQVAWISVCGGARVEPMLPWMQITADGTYYAHTQEEAEAAGLVPLPEHGTPAGMRWAADEIGGMLDGLDGEFSVYELRDELRAAADRMEATEVGNVHVGLARNPRFARLRAAEAEVHAAPAPLHGSGVRSAALHERGGLTMASEPTDLIREADEHHQACCPDVTEDCECLGCGEEWPCEVRRLRDALATDGDACGTCLAIAREARKDASLFENLYDEARAALAEANATIQRVKALAEKYDDQCGSCGSISGGRSIAEDIRRAIEGP